MKKIVGIYVGPLYFPPERMHKWDEKNLQEGGIGGSEIWAIEIASQFEKKGYHCIVFADCEKWHYAKDGVEYVPVDRFTDVCSYMKFNYFITSRRVYELSENIKADKIYLMAHDPFILWADSYNDLYPEKINKITYQSDFQKRLLKSKYVHLDDSDFFKTFQAIDPSLYGNIDDSSKKNKMLWSSHKIRGARILIEKIYPIIKKEIPDFEIDVCGYVNDIEDDYFKTDGINIKGNVTKDELIRLQKESKIWIYPNWGYFEDGRINDETFCITAIENAMAKNAIVVADRTCFSSTLKGYKGFVGTELFGDNDCISEEQVDEFADILAKQAIKILKNNEYRHELADDAYELCKEYNWENAVDTFINEFNKDDNHIINKNINEMEKELIILSAIGFRPYNSEKLLNSIIKNFNDSEINVTWVMCYDKINCNADMSGIIEKCKAYQEQNPRFGWFFCPSGRGEKNYGGDIFNDSLKWVKDTYFANSNPWVYVLDDDNVINPLMAESLVSAMNVAERDNKHIIYYNIMYGNGIIAPLCHDTFCPSVERNGLTPYYQVTDPSQLVIRYSLLEQIGFYDCSYDYDIVLWRHILNTLSDNDVVFPEDWSGNQALNRYQTTHNGISSQEEKEKWYGILGDDSKAKSCALMICTNEDANDVFLIDEKDMKEIFEKYVLKHE